MRRCHASHGRRATGLGGADCAVLAVDQALCVHGHHRCEVDGPAAGQYRVDPRAAHGGGAEVTRRAEPAAGGIPGVDDGHAGPTASETAGQGMISQFPSSTRAPLSREHDMHILLNHSWDNRSIALTKRRVKWNTSACSFDRESARNTSLL